MASRSPGRREIRVADDAGLAVPPARGGELQARGSDTIRGYYRAEPHERLPLTALGKMGKAVLREEVRRRMETA
ncbi:MAG TPA: hypothetical protein VFV05_00775 [Methylomirabilota bacterium]|nr:hypothetical protein [Methylomirabilota bacterium]